MRILGISGSLRRDSYNTALLRHAGELFGAEVRSRTRSTALLAEAGATTREALAA